MHQLHSVPDVVDCVAWRKNSLVPTFKSNATDIMKKAWSCHWMIAAFIFTILETAMPYLQAWLPVPDPLFGILSGVCVAGAYLSRLLVQNNLAG